MSTPTSLFLNREGTYNIIQSLHSQVLRQFTHCCHLIPEINRSVQKHFKDRDQVSRLKAQLLVNPLLQQIETVKQREFVLLENLRSLSEECQEAEEKGPWLASRNFIQQIQNATKISWQMTQRMEQMCLEIQRVNIEINIIMKQSKPFRRSTGSVLQKKSFSK